MRDYIDYDPELSSQHGEGVFTRICAGFIESVDEENGTVTVDFEDFVGKRNSVSLSFGYFSSVGPGWFRFMPSIGDKVLCGFRPNNQVEILQYKPVSYTQFVQLAKDANPPFIFRKLKSGEFEIMSSGYAEIWGSRAGRLHLAGGLVTIDLDRDSNQATHNAALHLLKSAGSEVRFGAVRRVNPLKTTADESQVAPGIADKEYRVTLVQSIAGVTKKLYDATIGKVLDYTAALPSGIFTPRKSPDTGQNLVADLNVYTADGVQKVQFRVDELGNARFDLPASASDGLRVAASLGTLLVNMLNVQLNASNNLNLNGATAANLTSSVLAKVSAPQSQLAGATASVTADSQLELKNAVASLGPALDQLLLTLQTLLTAMSTATPATVVASIAAPSGAALAQVTVVKLILQALLR